MSEEEVQRSRRSTVRLVGAAFVVLLVGAVWATWLSATADWPRRRFEFAVIAGICASTAGYLVVSLARVVRGDRERVARTAKEAAR